MIFAADIGGTKTVLALYADASDASPVGEPVYQAVYPSREFPDFGKLVTMFLDGAPASKIGAACLGVAGPVIAGRCQTTNLPWLLDERILAEQLGTDIVCLLNDVEAAAYGMTYLNERELAVLTPENPARPGHVILIAAGTGLGQAILCWDGERYHPMASEGGHADFAPRSEQEAALLAYLAKRFDHVSYERILSGPGLFNIYQFLRDTRRAEEPQWLREQINNSDPGRAIAEAALGGRHDICVETLQLFVRIYGAAAGNLALHAAALGGVYIGGGIAPKILPSLQSGEFLEAFRAKGRYEPFLHAIRVSVALNPRAPLIGAAQFAKTLRHGGLRRSTGSWRPDRSPDSRHHIT